MSITQRSTLFDDIEVVYDSHSTGDESLVFIHGWTCSSALWQDQLPLFTRYRTILIDLPGHGRSAAPADIEYSHEFFANAINAVLDQESIVKAVLIGHSMGGPIATMTLRLFPEKVSAVIYIDSFFNLPESYLTHAQRKQQAERHSDNVLFRDLLNDYFTDRTTDSMKTQIVDTMTSTAKHVRCNATTTIMQPHAWAWDEIYDIPALHLVTPMFEKIDGAWLRHIPRLETRLWKDNGHFLFMEDEERFNGEVGQWLEEKGVMKRTA